MFLDTREYVAEFNTPGTALAIADDELRRAVRACEVGLADAARPKWGGAVRPLIQPWEVAIGKPHVWDGI